MKKTVLRLVSVVLMVIAISGCGSKSEDYASSESYDASYATAGEEYATDDIYAVEEAAPAMESPAPAEGESAKAVETNAATAVDSNRKLIKNVNLSVQTEEFDTLMSKIDLRIEQIGGYAESTNVSGKNYYDEASSRTANLTIRIPSSKLEEFVNNISEISNVTNKSESAEDVTLQYVDTEAHRDSLKIEQKRLEELLEQADTLEAIIALENRMTEVRYQLESYESQLRMYDNLVDYSTIYLYVEEVNRITPQVDESRWDRIRVGFVESLYDVASGFLDFIVAFIIALPFLIVWAVIITLVVLITKGILRYRKQRKEKKAFKVENNTNTVEQKK